MSGRRMWTAVAATMSLVAGHAAQGVEGMWTPDQLPEIAGEMRAVGLEIDPAQLENLTGFPMGAVIWLGNCTASFVSPQGLAVTNHHCARGSVQYNSTEEQNYLAEGFLAGSREEELRAAPGSRVYVTTEVTDVTERVLGDLSEELPPRDRYQAIEDRQKALVAECEEREGRRCDVVTFHGGAEYRLIEKLEIRDVRLVYAPGDSIGRYGGFVDNWQWPRQTGDFAFYRAYVGPDGRPADYAEENVPFEPEHWLKVSRAGLDAGDFVMVAGYPGTTRRYTRLSEVEHQFGWFYPTYERVLADWIAAIEAAAPEGSDARIRYESRLSGLTNYMQNIGGQIAGARRVDLTGKRAAREAALDAWIAADAERRGYAAAIDALDEVVEEQNADAKDDFWFSMATRPQLLAAARTLYRLSLERQKPDAEREPGYQERDLKSIRGSLERLERRYHPDVDRAEWLLFLEDYMDQPADVRVAAFDEALGLPDEFDHDAVSALLDRYYAQTDLGDIETRLEWMERSPGDFEASEDPFIRLAVALHPYTTAEEEEEKRRAGRLTLLRPAYMEAIIAFNRAEGRLVYPDANSTLRVSFGTVQGGAPRDGLRYLPFTTLGGIVEKHTGVSPFDAPERQLSLIEERAYGPYELDSLGSVPVNFLADLDITGGNSGSATLDANGNLVGLAFDGTIESVNSDWDFDPRTTRSIHVDSRYMLWVMEKVDGAGHLVEEMTLTTTP